jgi:hypothetical protein
MWQYSHVFGSPLKSDKSDEELFNEFGIDLRHKLVAVARSNHRNTIYLTSCFMHSFVLSADHMKSDDGITFEVALLRWMKKAVESDIDHGAFELFDQNNSVFPCEMCCLQ